jgi:polyisoprenoid-binding protein YceI
MFRLLVLAPALVLAASSSPRLVELKAVSFNATGPAGLSIVGRANALEFEQDGDHVILRVPLDGVDTGIELRNRHMREKYLETAKFPHAELRVPASAMAAGPKRTVEGTFTVHGRQKPVTVTYAAEAKGDGLLVDGTFHINLKDYAIDVPNYLGVTVKPDVSVTATFVVAP